MFDFNKDSTHSQITFSPTTKIKVLTNNNYRLNENSNAQNFAQSEQSETRHSKFLRLMQNTRISHLPEITPSRCKRPERVYPAFLEGLFLCDKSRAKLYEINVTDDEINFLMLRDSPSFPLNLLVCDELRRRFGLLDDCEGFTRRTYETFDYYALTLKSNCILDISPYKSHGGLLGLERNRFNGKPDGIRFYHLHDDNRSFRIKTRPQQIQSLGGVQ